MTGVWTAADQSITAGANCGIRLSFDPSDVYLDVGGTGTVTASINGRTKTYTVSGAPDIYTIVHQASARPATVTLTIAPGLTAYSFTFG